MTPAALLVRVGHGLFGDWWKVDMAYAVGVSIDHIEDWSRGRGQPPRGVWRDLASFIQERERTLAGLEAHVLHLVYTTREVRAGEALSQGDAEASRLANPGRLRRNPTWLLSLLVARRHRHSGPGPSGDSMG